MIAEHLPDNPSFEQLPQTPNFSPKLYSNLRSESPNKLVIDIDLLSYVLSQSKNTVVTWTPHQVSQFLVSIWKLPKFMESDISSFCTQADLTGDKLLSLNDDGLAKLGFNNLWTCALMDALQLIFKHFPDKLPLHELCKTPEPKFNFNEINYNLKRKLSFLQKYYPLMNDCTMLEFNQREDFVEFENDDGSSSVFDLCSEAEGFDDDSVLDMSLDESNLSLPDIIQSNVSHKVTRLNKQFERMEPNCNQNWILYIGIGGLIGYKLIRYISKS